MILIKCHIDNFGKIHDRDIFFDEHIHVIQEDNGWGKSTLATFIRVMFYGFMGEGKHKAEDNERKKYHPWQGGAYGGTITFEIDGNIYTLTRHFGKKVKEDTFELRNAITNLLSSDYSQNIGQEIFQVNCQSFVNTVFIGQNSCVTSTTDDINTKIGNLADNPGDMNNYEAAQNRIKDRLNKLTPNRETGSLSKLKKHIAMLDYQIRQSAGVEDTLSQKEQLLHEKREDLKAIKKERDEKVELQNKCAKHETLREQHKQWNDWQYTVTHYKDTAADLKDKFPGAVPVIAELKEQQQVCNQMVNAKAKLESTILDNDQQKKLAGYKKIFAEHIPREEDVAKYQELSRQLNTLRLKKASVAMNDQELARLKKLRDVFEAETPDISTVSGSWNVRNMKKQSIAANKATLASMQYTRQSQPKAGSAISLPLVAGVVLTLLGIVLLIMNYPIPGSVLTALGVICAILGLVTKKTPGNDSSTSELSKAIQDLEETIRQDEQFIQETDRMVTIYIARHGREYDENMVTAILQQLSSEQYEYSMLQQRYQNMQSVEQEANPDNIAATIVRYLKQFGINAREDEFGECISRLWSNYQEYHQLHERSNQAEKANSAYLEYHRKIEDYLTGLSISMEFDPRLVANQLLELHNQADDYYDAERDYTNAVRGLKLFETNHDMAEIKNFNPNENLPSSDEIAQSINQLLDNLDDCQESIQGYEAECESLREQLDARAENIAELDMAMQKQKEQQQMFDCLTYAKDNLATAKEQMTAKYSDPIYKSFCNYIQAITPRTTESYHIDANTKITFDAHGEQRETTMLSCGYQDLVGFCLRVALVDAMYPDENPVLIMDDPFVNLDDSKMEAAKSLVETISDQYQVIYFTCSNSRAV